MFKMQTKSGVTTVTQVSTNRTVSFDSPSEALKYVGLFDVMFRHPRGRLAGEAYPVRELNPGKYPINIKI